MYVCLEILTPHIVRTHFGVPGDLEEIDSSDLSSSSSSSSDSSSDSSFDSSIGSPPASPGIDLEPSNDVSLLDPPTSLITMDQSQLDVMKSTMNDLAQQAKTLSDKLENHLKRAAPDSSVEVSVLSVDGIKVASAAEQVLQQLNVIESTLQPTPARYSSPSKVEIEDVDEEEAEAKVKANGQRKNLGGNVMVQLASPTIPRGSIMDFDGGLANAIQKMRFNAAGAGGEEEEEDVKEEPPQQQTYDPSTSFVDREVSRIEKELAMIPDKLPAKPTAGGIERKEPELGVIITEPTFSLSDSPKGGLTGVLESMAGQISTASRRLSSVTFASDAASDDDNEQGQGQEEEVNPRFMRAISSVTAYETELNSPPSPPEPSLPTHTTLLNLPPPSSSISEALSSMELGINALHQKQERKGSLCAPDSPMKKASNFHGVPPPHPPPPATTSYAPSSSSQSSKNSQAAVVEAYKAAVTTALTSFSSRFEALEDQMTLITTNLATIGQQQQEGGQRRPITFKLPSPSPPQPPPPVSKGSTIPGTSEPTSPPSSPPSASPMRSENLISLAKQYSPPISNVYAATPSNRLFASNDGTQYGTPREGTSNTPMGMASMSSPAPALKITPRYSRNSIGNLSMVSGISATSESSDVSIYGSRRKHMASSSLRAPDKISSYGKPARSPYRTRNRSDEYFRSLQHESSRRISFSKDINKVRRTPTRASAPVSEKKVHQEYSRGSPGRTPGAKAGNSMYHLSEGARVILEKRRSDRGISPIASPAVSPKSSLTRKADKGGALSSPPTTYTNLHQRRGGKGLSLGKQDTAATPKLLKSRISD